MPSLTLKAADYEADRHNLWPGDSALVHARTVAATLHDLLIRRPSSQRDEDGDDDEDHAAPTPLSLPEAMPDAVKKTSHKKILEALRDVQRGLAKLATDPKASQEDKLAKAMAALHLMAALPLSDAAVTAINTALRQPLRGGKPPQPLPRGKSFQKSDHAAQKAAVEAAKATLDPLAWQITRAGQGRLASKLAFGVFFGITLVNIVNSLGNVWHSPTSGTGLPIGGQSGQGGHYPPPPPIKTEPSHTFTMPSGRQAEVAGDPTLPPRRTNQPPPPPSAPASSTSAPNPPPLPTRLTAGPTPAPQSTNPDGGVPAGTPSPNRVPNATAGPSGIGGGSPGSNDEASFGPWKWLTPILGMAGSWWGHNALTEKKKGWEDEREKLQAVSVTAALNTLCSVVESFVVTEEKRLAMPGRQAHARRAPGDSDDDTMPGAAESMHQMGGAANSASAVGNEEQAGRSPGV